MIGARRSGVERHLAIGRLAAPRHAVLVQDSPSCERSEEIKAGAGAALRSLDRHVAIAIERRAFLPVICLGSA
jgi:hypothetical protein